MYNIREEINQILDDAWSDDFAGFFSQEEIANMRTELIESIGGYEKLEEQLAVGVKNGYSIKDQLELVRLIIKRMKNEEANQG